MVTCNIDLNAKMNRQRRGRTSSNSSGFRLLDDQCDTVSSVSRNSIYKQKIDSMFDDSRYVISPDSFMDLPAPTHLNFLNLGDTQ